MTAPTTVYLTPAEVAPLLQRSEDYVTRLCRTSQLRAMKLGNAWRIHPDAVTEFMSGGKSKSTRPRKSARQMRQSA